MDHIGNFGTYLISEMREMSKGRYKAFKREVQALLLKYQSSTEDDEDDDKQAQKKSRCSDTQSSQQSCGSGRQYTHQQPSSAVCGGFGDWQPHPFNRMSNPSLASSWQSAGRGYPNQYYNRMQQDQQQQQYQGPLQHQYGPHPQQSQTQPSSSNKGPESSNITTMALVSSGINIDSPQVMDISLLDSVNLPFATATPTTECIKSSSK